MSLILGVLGRIPVVGWVIAVIGGILTFVFWIIGMVNAFRFGAPPHGGCALGIDRMVMLLADEANIREVIMFPMNQRAEDLMMGAPSEPMNEQLRELRLRVLPPES